ncbi:MAG: hypothetical protein RLZZ19_834, partial [Actinomycetota bacterium]
MSDTLPVQRKITTKPRPSDVAFRGIVTSFGFINLAILTLIGAFLLFRGIEVFTVEGLSFFTDQKWEVTEESGITSGNIGIGAMLIGTLIAALIALVVALPVSVLTALMLNFYAPIWIRTFFITVIDLMAAFPSILFGLWGFFVLMPSAEYWA